MKCQLRGDKEKTVVLFHDDFLGVDAGETMQEASRCNVLSGSISLSL